MIGRPFGNLKRKRALRVAGVSLLLMVVVVTLMVIVLVGFRERAPRPGDRFAVISETGASKAAHTANGDELEAARYLAARPTAYWLVPERDAVDEVRAKVITLTDEAREQDAILALVVYGLPDRDCGGQSAGGLESRRYTEWIAEIAAGIEQSADVGVVLILEPDSLAQASNCGSVDDRAAVLQSAIAMLQRERTWIYLDGGNSRWLSAAKMAAALNRVGLDRVRGFALNVSNFIDSTEETAYAHDVIAALRAEGVSDVHAVIDTSRNGSGANGQWCNPPGRTVGAVASSFGDDVVDTNLWIKPPGESDGRCNGGPAAGQWWGANAVELTRDVRATPSPTP